MERSISRPLGRFIVRKELIIRQVRCIQSWQRALPLASKPKHHGLLVSNLNRESATYGQRQSYTIDNIRSAHTLSSATSIMPDHTHIPKVTVALGGQKYAYSAILLRDMCQCPSCVHEHTGQRLFSTTDIPSAIEAREVFGSGPESDTISIRWTVDIPGFDTDHETTLRKSSLDAIVAKSAPSNHIQGEASQSVLWNLNTDNHKDFDYKDYMEDDEALLRMIEQLHTHGLAFVTNAPGIEESVAKIAERIGPVKDTFYGRTWDVRTVPKAINAAYTSNDLGFHTDLLYFDNPPHIQLLHCIQSSSSGGASVFADAFKCAAELYETDRDAFNILATTRVNFHYEHPDSNIYRTSKPVFDLRPLRIGRTTYNTLSDFLDAWTSHRHVAGHSNGRFDLPPLGVVDCLDKINWGPPFMAPFSIDADIDAEFSSSLVEDLNHGVSPLESLNDKVDKWYVAARKFSSLLERSENLHERLMKPGDCVLFNNTRVLHSRRAFNSNDLGKARWLKGTYVDKDPFMSKLRVLRGKYKA